MKNLPVSFIRSSQGNVAIIVGICIFALLAVAGVAIDLSRGHLLRTRMQDDVDTATLSAGIEYNKNPTLTNDELTLKVQQYFNATFPTNYLGSTTPVVSVSFDGASINASAQAHLSTMLMRIFGQNDMLISTNASVLHDVAIPAEVVLSLDFTGSMSNYLPGSNSSKYYGLYTAATNFVNLLAAANDQNKIFVGIVPYTQTVNIGVPGVGSVPAGKSFSSGKSIPTWNSDSSWLDAADPSLGYDWASDVTDVYGNTLTNVGTQNPHGWGGCVMARASNTQGSNGLTLDLSDDPPSVAPFQRFYFPSDQGFFPWWGDQGCNMCSGYSSGLSGSGNIGENGSAQYSGRCDYSSYAGHNPWACHTQYSTGTSYWINYDTNIASMTGSPALYTIPWTSGPNYTCPMIGKSPISIYPLEPAQTPGLLGTISAAASLSNPSYSDATVTAQGMAWAYRLMSSKWAGLWQDGIDDASINWRAKPPSNLKKFVILMTDGTNNTHDSGDYGGTVGSYAFTAYGLVAPDGQNFGINPPNAPTTQISGTPPWPLQAADLDNKMLQICTQMKAENITIYTIGFGTTGTGTGTDVNADLLSKCATDPSKFILASDNIALNRGFQNIANEIVQNLRITQ